MLAPGDGFSLNLWAQHGEALRDAVAGAPRAPWRLLFARADLAGRTIDVSAAPGTWTRVDDVVLATGARLEVTVTDGAQPVKGAKVTLARDPGGAPNPVGPSTLPAAETNESGVAMLSGLLPGCSCSVLVTHPQFLPHHSDLLPPLARGDTTPLTIALERGAMIEGQVRANGDLSDGLHVRLFQSGPRDVFARAIKVVECDRDGRFAFSGLAAGSYDLEARSSSQRVALRDRVPVAAGQRITDIDLLASSSFAITIEIVASDSTRGNRVVLEAWDPASDAAEPVARRFLVLAGKGPRYGPFYVDTPHAGPFTLKLMSIATPGNFTQPLEQPGAMAGAKVVLNLDASR
ncbi:MAG: carboxypeptidase-like regulatory domain-containing protein [Planctomycetota bacterium]